MTIDELKKILLEVYSKETAHPDWQDKWSKENPTCGQCVPTALLVQYYFGGDICRHNIESHYFNVINNHVVDLTKEQFDYDLDYSNSVVKQPDQNKANVKQRFELLKDRVEEYVRKFIDKEISR